MDQTSKKRFLKLIDLNFSDDILLKSSLDDFLDLEEIDSKSLQDVLFVVGNYHDRLKSYRLYADKLSLIQKKEYQSLRLLRKGIIEKKIGYSELKNHFSSVKKLC